MSSLDQLIEEIKIAAAFSIEAIRAVESQHPGPEKRQILERALVELVSAGTGLAFASVKYGKPTVDMRPILHLESEVIGKWACNELPARGRDDGSGNKPDSGGDRPKDDGGQVAKGASDLGDEASIRV